MAEILLNFFDNIILAVLLVHAGIDCFAKAALGQLVHFWTRTAVSSPARFASSFPSTTVLFSWVL